MGAVTQESSEDQKPKRMKTFYFLSFLILAFAFVLDARPQTLGTIGAGVTTTALGAPLVGLGLLGLAGGLAASRGRGRSRGYSRRNNRRSYRRNNHYHYGKRETDEFNFDLDFLR